MRQSGVVGGKLKACPSKPNCVCSEDSDPGHAIEPLAFEGDAGRAFRALLALVSSDPLGEVRETTDTYAHAVYRTPVLRFKDDVEFRLDSGAKRIHVRSASRIGYSDLGANRRRIESLRARWNAARVPVAG
jgi:uncharacterized protein (DUF1499 family)